VTRTLGVALVCAAGACACSRPLPDAESPPAKLYAARCGGCHAVYQPATLTPHMWQVQVERMDQKYRAVGQPVPTPQEKAQILDYLTRHAGG
jgi:hypothetical protein